MRWVLTVFEFAYTGEETYGESKCSRGRRNGRNSRDRCRLRGADGDESESKVEAPWREPRLSMRARWGSTRVVLSQQWSSVGKCYQSTANLSIAELTLSHNRQFNREFACSSGVRVNRDGNCWSVLLRPFSVGSCVMNWRRFVFQLPSVRAWRELTSSLTQLHFVWYGRDVLG